MDETIASAITTPNFDGLSFIVCSPLFFHHGHVTARVKSRLLCWGVRGLSVDLPHPLLWKGFMCSLNWTRLKSRRLIPLTALGILFSNGLSLGCMTPAIATRPFRALMVRSQ